jgi:hypothetical protein
MVIEKLDIVYGQTFREVEADGEKKSEPVEGTGTVEQINVKRLKWRRRNAIFASLKSDDGTVDFNKASMHAQEQFVIDMITESVCDADGKNIVTADDLDDLDVWSDARRNAYFAALAKYQSPKVADVAKNSSSTATGATS